MSMQKRDLLFILKSFFAWRIITLIVAIFSIRYIPLLGENFFGGKLINYIKNPLFWGWANFDGEHYLSIAMNGYKDLQQAFFPGYPVVVNLFSNLFGSEISAYLWSGIAVSNLFFIASLIVFWNTIRLDYSEKIAKTAIILLLVFPASFYFASVYSESLFLFASLLTYYLYRKEQYFWAGMVGIVMTSTRLYGVLILFMILVDVLIKITNFRKIVNDKIYLLGISVAGLLSYMWYSFRNYGDFFAFYNLQTLVGEQRSDHIILLPQVFYRYVVRILPDISWDYLPVVFTLLLELLVATLFLAIIVLSFKKVRWDYWVYLVLGYVIPTLTGSFSSLPRYVVVLFPAFIISAIFMEGKKSNMYLRVGIYIVSAIIGVLAEILFFRGYFVS